MVSGVAMETVVAIYGMNVIFNTNVKKKNPNKY